MRTCSVAGCNRQHKARGLCYLHYVRAKRAGEIVTIQHRWTRAELMTLRRMCKRGYTDAHIAAHLGRTVHAVDWQRGQLGLWRRTRGNHPTNPATMPDMPETEEPIVPNPTHYQPWECFRDADVIVRDGALPCWDSWLPMRAAMQRLEERDAARDARDAERYDVVFAAGQMRVRVREQVAA